MEDWWWVFFVFLITYGIQDESRRRALRSIEAKLGEVLRRLGGDPATIEAQLRQADQAAEAAAEAQELRLPKAAIPWGLVFMAVVGAAGALVGYWISPEAVYSGGAIGALIGLVLGTLVYGFREGLRA